MRWLDKLTGTSKMPFDVYKADNQPAVYLTQNTAEPLAKRAGSIAGVLVFADEMEGDEKAGVKLRIALAPAGGGRNLSLLMHLKQQPYITLGTVGFAKLPKPEQKQIIARINSLDSHKADLIVKERMRLRRNQHSPDHDAEADSNAMQKLADEHSLVIVEADGDNEKLTKTIRFLTEKGYLSERTVRALHKTMRSLTEPLSESTHMHNTQLLLEDIYKGVRVTRGIRGNLANEGL